MDLKNKVIKVPTKIIIPVITFIIGAIFLSFAGISASAAYGKLIDSVFGKPKYMIWTLVYASPLIFTGLSVAVLIILMH